MNPYTSNPEDICIKKEEMTDPTNILRQAKKKRRIDELLRRLSIKEVLVQNAEAEKEVEQELILIPAHFIKATTEDPAVLFADFSPA